MADYKIPRSVIILLIAAFSIGCLVMYALLNWVAPTGWILSANGRDLTNLPKDEIVIISHLFQNGNIFTQSELLEHFVIYYHSLIQILITIILFLAGFITFNFYKSRREYNDLMSKELISFLQKYERLLAEDDKNLDDDELDRFEYLQSWVRDYITRLLEESNYTLLHTASEAVIGSLLEDDGFLETIKGEIMSSLDDEGESDD